MRQKTFFLVMFVFLGCILNASKVGGTKIGVNASVDSSGSSGYDRQRVFSHRIPPVHKGRFDPSPSSSNPSLYPSPRGEGEGGVMGRER
ncbi:MAG: hypothetical protein AB1393_06495 [Candidatus Edwardsbacteria bacterium]